MSRDSGVGVEIIELSVCSEIVRSAVVSGLDEVTEIAGLGGGKNTGFVARGNVVGVIDEDAWNSQAMEGGLKLMPAARKRRCFELRLIGVWFRFRLREADEPALGSFAAFYPSSALGNAELSSTSSIPYVRNRCDNLDRAIYGAPQD